MPARTRCDQAIALQSCHVGNRGPWSVLVVKVLLLLVDADHRSKMHHMAAVNAGTAAGSSWGCMRSCRQPGCRAHVLAALISAALSARSTGMDIPSSTCMGQGQWFLYVEKQRRHQTNVVCKAKRHQSS